MKKAVSILILLFAFSQIQAQTNIKVGQKAPQINITHWIENVSADKNLNGKYLVLEFWATWCGPCLAAVPHMNELQEEFDREDLYFVSITDESVAKVERKLKRIPFQSIVVSDTTKSTQISYGDGKKGLAALPLTVLIDNEGIVRWIGVPQKLDKEVMQNFLNDKEIISKVAEAKAKDSGVEEFLALIKNKELDYVFQLEKSDVENFQNMRVQNKIIKMEAATLNDIYVEFFEKQKSQINIPASLEDQKFDLIYKNTRDQNPLAALEKEILDFLKLKKETEIKKVPVYKVEIVNEDLLEETLETKFSGYSDAGDKMVFTACSIEKMLDEVGKKVEENFRYNGNDTKQYDFVVHVNSKEDLMRSLEAYGLSADEQMEEVEMIRLLK